MPTLPALPADLPRETLTEAVVLRICHGAFAGAEPGFRAVGAYRFDAPDRSFGTCYAARDFRTCFFETIVRDGSLNIARSEYEKRSVVVLLLDVANLHLVPIYGDDAKNLRLDLADLAGKDYTFTQGALQGHARSCTITARPRLPFAIR